VRVLIFGLSRWRAPDQPLGTQEPVPDRRTRAFTSWWQTQSDPPKVGKQKTNTPMLFMFVNVRAVHIRITNGEKKQNSLSGMFCRISFIPNHFNRNTKRNRFVPVIFELVTISDICDQNVTKSVLLKKNKTRACDRGHKFKIVTFCDRHKCRTLSVTSTKPVSVSVRNPDRNTSNWLYFKLRVDLSPPKN